MGHGRSHPNADWPSLQGSRPKPGKSHLVGDWAEGARKPAPKKFMLHGVGFFVLWWGGGVRECVYLQMKNTAQLSGVGCVSICAWTTPGLATINRPGALQHQGSRR